MALVSKRATPANNGESCTFNTASFLGIDEFAGALNLGIESYENGSEKHFLCHTLNMIWVIHTFFC